MSLPDIDNFLEIQEQEDLSAIDEMIKDLPNQYSKVLDTRPKRGRPTKKEEEERKNDYYDIVLNQYQKKFVLFQPPFKINKETNIKEYDDIGEVLFSGGVGSGKSFALCCALLNYVQVPNTTVLLLHQHLSTLKKTTLRLLLEGETTVDGTWRPPLLPVGAFKKWNRSEGIITLNNNSKIICSGVINSDKLRSINAVAAFIDEVNLISEECYASIRQRCRIYNGLANCVYSVCNPKSKNHWCYKLFNINKKPGIREMITVSTVTNKNNLPKSYIISLEQEPEPRRTQMLKGEWVALSETVFFAFNSEKHIGNYQYLLSDSNNTFIISQDAGGGAGYCAMHLLCKTPNKKMYCLDEFHKKGVTHYQILEWMNQYRELTKAICAYDPANRMLKNDMINDGWKTISIKKDIEGSIARINDQFSLNNLFIDRNKCPSLIKELENASRKEDSGEIDKSKEFDAIDSLRYGTSALIDEDQLPKEEEETFLFAMKF